MRIRNRCIAGIALLIMIGQNINVYDDINTPEKSLDFMQPIGSLQRVGEFGFGTNETRQSNRQPR